MEKPTCEQLLELDPTRRTVEDSWRHGTRVTEVYFRERDNTYWQAKYRLSTDGECNELREGYAKICQVVPRERTVTVYEPIDNQS